MTTRTAIGLRVASRLTVALAVAVLVAAGGTVAVPDVLRGTAVMNGSARGTAVVMLAVWLPLAVVGLVPTVLLLRRVGTKDPSRDALRL